MSDPAFKGPGSKPSGQMIQAPNTLRDRVGSRLGRIDPSAIARAEAALKGLSSQFGQWLQDEIVKLETARAIIRSGGMKRETVDQLYTHAHDLKGLGATYGYPLITRLAGSLCKLLGEAETRLQVPMFLVDKHIDSIRACVRDGIKDAESPVGRILAEELEQRVAAHMKGQV